MVNFQPRQIMGAWEKGFSLDLHTVSSEFCGYDELGHARFNNTRSEVGELLYRLKNKADQTVVPNIVMAVEKFMSTANPVFDIIVPVPPSTPRNVQPVLIMAKAISHKLNIPLAECVTRTRDIQQLKNVFDLDERLKLLDGLHAVDRSATQNKRILLFDDLYRSGATMNAITTELYQNGAASNVYALTITKTRSNQ